MLRVETKKNGETAIDTIVQVKHDELKTISTLKVPVYSNRIKEAFPFMPRQHYLTLVSIYVPFKPYGYFGDIVYSVKRGQMWYPKTSITHDKIINRPEDIISFLHHDSLDIEIKDGYFYFNTSLPVTESSAGSVEFSLHLSIYAAWMLGFKKTHYQGKLGDVLKTDIQHPPILTKYIQILCHNVGGTKDSNMTFPEAVAIYPVVSKEAVYAPTAAINCRIEKGKVLDIEILDQDNRPFVHSPVYLEFYMLEGAEHEKRQGFFRIQKNTKLIFTEPIRKIALPYLYAFCVPPVIIENTTFELICTVIKKGKLETKNLTVVVPVIKGMVLSRVSLVNIIHRWNLQISTVFGAGPYIAAHFENNVLILKLIKFLQVKIKKSFLNELAMQKPANGTFDIHYKDPLRIEIKPEYLYTSDQRLLIFCKEYSEVHPVVVATHHEYTFRIINPNFWHWCELEKPTNTLTFRYQMLSNHGDGYTSIVDGLPREEDIIANLFYK